MNVVILIGRLTRDPELKYMPITGTPIARFTLAVDKELNKDKKKEMEEKGLPTADFINIVIWGKQAENCANYLRKGRLAAVHGRLRSRSYEGRDGVRRYVTEVMASRVEFLERGDKQSSNESENWDFDIDGFESADEDNIPF